MSHTALPKTKLSQTEAFGNAQWITSTDAELCPIIKKNFIIDGFDEITIDIVGFAAFNFYVNGTVGTNDLFLPLATDFERREAPRDEVTRHRVYISHYDITELCRCGENVLTVMLGDGWYTGHTGKFVEVPYGEKKVCFKITVKNGDSETSIVSDLDATWRDSYLKKSDLNFGEEQDLKGYDTGFLGGGGDGWLPVRYSVEPKTDFYYTTCPPDRIIEEITPSVISSGEGFKIYDVGKNITGYPTLLSKGYIGEVKVLYSEDVENGDLREKNMHGQKTIYRVYGNETLLEPAFTWLGFRYFKVHGEAEVVSVKRIHCDLAETADFSCNNETLNWLFRAFVNTQLSNMHQGIPSDCPHIERRGYLGDGHLTCRAAMLSLDAKDFYEKWIKDISDCQDSISGHAQYTAPYTHSGGGPGGFAHGFIKIPYEYYLRYGDVTPLVEMYPQFHEYLRYLEEHSVCDLLTSDKEGEWCLGDWCVPAEKPGDTVIPPPFVNTVYYVKSMLLLKDIAKIIGKAEDIPALDERIERKKKAITAAYFNPNNGDFIGNRQGGNAFALDIGLGDERTRQNFIDYYDRLGYYDTGIFGTETVTRLLFDYGRDDIATKLLTADKPHGFGKWMKAGATTLWEYWNSPRSMSHPMFGGVTALLFEDLLGIRQAPDTCGYTDLIIEPSVSSGLTQMSGYITLNGSRLSVSFTKEDAKLRLECEVPKGVRATVRLCSREHRLYDGGTVSLCCEVDC